MTANWSTVRLGEVLVEEKVRVGSFDADGLPLLGVSNTSGLHRSEKPRIIDMSRYLRVERSWFAYNPMRINVGSIGWAERFDQTGVISPDYVVFSCTERIEPKLLYLFVRSFPGLRAINLETAGSVRERLYFDSLARIRYPLPPLSEQRRIVARIEELTAKINESRYLRHEAAREVETLVANEIKARFDRGKKSGWTCGTLGGYVIDDCYGTSEKANDDDSGTPVLRMGNIQNGRLDLRELKYLHVADKDRAKLVLKRGEILVNRTNSAELVGKCAVFDVEGDFAFASYLIRLRLDTKRADPRLVASYINSPAGRSYMFSERKQMTGQANVNATKLKALPLALPPISEQRRIAAELDALQERVDALKKLQAETAAELDALLPSVLDRAFKGDL
jgi:type I restriction enzyme, S subunit